ncbi:MAG: NAD+ synthase [Acidobacteria bacterium]|nr:NAD+ synthase [Acidobacteriota bacterium]NIM63747.1 NAD+ synthase [Acidobacteriota bacterium]NIO59316.1 NAD+ synthase [Acidobacteriota bacterium]NIQ30330.1 NAD+ synthase [Acidobacteriota bacterium]NIQ85267.1 NAD+ synthase [Acidobacteriota bacterium]
MTDAPAPLDGSLELDPEWTARILTRFIDQELHRTGLTDLVLGLSGGIDSAVVAYLAARAIEPRRVHACLMPYRASSEDSLSDARKVVAELGIDAETIDITPLVDGFEKTAGSVGRTRLGNVMARARMTLLYDRSVEHGALVLGTSNKTELLLGYGTLHGDLASAINPIGDLYKTQVRHLAGHLGVPDSIRRKPPSADLWPDQNDEEELGFSYAEVDRLLALLIDARASRATAIEAGFTPELVDGVTRRIVRSQFKRVPPVIAKISTRSIGSDFRYPRDWMT